MRFSRSALRRGVEKQLQATPVCAESVSAEASPMMVSAASRQGGLRSIARSLPRPLPEDLRRDQEDVGLGEPRVLPDIQGRRRPLLQRSRCRKGNAGVFVRRRTSSSAISSMTSIAGLAALIPSYAGLSVRPLSATSTVSLRSPFSPTCSARSRHRAASSFAVALGDNMQSSHASPPIQSRETPVLA